ncbi:MAG TPA: hypothetical protein VF651_06250 [Gammaproteobacteria bacterium]
MDHFNSIGESITSFDVTWMPVGKLARRVISRANSRKTAKYPSFRMGHMLHCESELELDGDIMFDVNPAVTHIQAQPAVVRVRFSTCGVEERLTHYPDRLVHLGGRRLVIEYKYEAEANHPDVKARTAMMKHGFSDLGIKYEVYTERFVRNLPERVATAKKVLFLGRDPVSEIERERIRHIFLANPAIIMRDVRQGLLGEHGLPKICNLYLTGHVQIALSCGLGDLTEVRWAAAAARPPPTD